MTDPSEYERKLNECKKILDSFQREPQIIDNGHDLIFSSESDYTIIDNTIDIHELNLSEYNKLKCQDDLRKFNEIYGHYKNTNDVITYSSKIVRGVKTILWFIL